MIDPRTPSAPTPGVSRMRLSIVVLAALVLIAVAL
jgi:hypothetical protein